MGLFVETDRVLDQLGEDWVNWMIRELTVTRTRTAIRAKWKKSGGNWQVAGYTRKKYKGKISKGGPSTKTLDYRIEENADGSKSLYLLGEEYLRFVDEGRAPFGKPSQGFKGVPVKKMNRWVANSKIKPQNTVKGGFIANNPKNRRAMAFMMNRKIKHFGIEPTNIISESRDKALELNQQMLIDAIGADVANYIDTNFLR
jgi:hypothetical protein